VIGFTLAVAAILLIAILMLNHGTFVYTLDDPYIHLALSDQIRHGNYGIQTGEHSSPASSILYPFLLATVASTPVHPYISLILNLLATVATVELIRRYIFSLCLGSDRFAVVLQTITILLMIMCFNVIGVAFTGLEHSLHIAVTVAVLYGTKIFLDQGKLPAWLPAALVLAPLLRYEGLALSLSVLIVIAVRKLWRTAAIVLLVILLLVGGFSVFLLSMHLPPLPSSVLVKTGMKATGGIYSSFKFLLLMTQNLNQMRNTYSRMLLAAIGLSAGIYLLWEFSDKSLRWSSAMLTSFILFVMIAGHAVFGKFGMFYRYEAYLLVGTALMATYLLQDTIRKALAEKQRRYIYVTVMVMCLLTIFGHYINMTMEVPLASNNIYEQQYQMHRFVTEFYHGPVAVNDIGLVTYKNPNYVLDLVGLSSDEARRLNLNNPTAADYQALLARHNIHLAMVYDEWFAGKIPANWVKVATLKLSRKVVSVGGSEVQFYATDAATEEKILPELDKFKVELPLGVMLSIHK